MRRTKSGTSAEAGALNATATPMIDSAAPPSRSALQAIVPILPFPIGRPHQSALGALGTTACCSRYHRPNDSVKPDTGAGNAGPGNTRQVAVYVAVIGTLFPAVSSPQNVVEPVISKVWVVPRNTQMPPWN